MELSFKHWMEIYGGHTPVKQKPVDPDPAPGQTSALTQGTLDKSDLPPTPRHPWMKKQLKKKMKRK